MVISMDRNKFVWNTSFPSLTVCPHKRIDDTKLEKYMKYELANKMYKGNTLYLSFLILANI